VEGFRGVATPGYVGRWAECFIDAYLTSVITQIFLYPLTVLYRGHGKKYHTSTPSIAFPTFPFRFHRNSDGYYHVIIFVNVEPFGLIDMGKRGLEGNAILRRRP
jgi:hypothetical protein